MKMKIYSFILDLFFPNRCPVCKRVIKWNEDICDDCEKELIMSDNTYCIKCGKYDCMCNSKEIYYDNAFSVLIYKGKSRNSLINFKLGDGINLASYAAKKLLLLLKNYKLDYKCDVVLAIPMHKSKKADKGFNPPYELAKNLAKKMNIKSYDNILIKKDKRLIQHSLNYEERNRSVNGAFDIRSSKIPLINNKTVLLCDDVITTGSTLNECARLLKTSGANKVICVTIASTKL